MPRLHSERLMFIKRMLSGATALALFGIAAAAQAVSLGNLTVESRPGEPLEAVLEIEDLDLTISPLLVRVAPPATYLREGVTWPSQVQDLKLARDSGTSNIRLRVYSAQVMDNAAFPLLIEMNAGGTVTVRTYDIGVRDGVFTVTPSAVKTTVQGAAKREKPEPLAVPASTEPAHPVKSEPVPAVEAKPEPKPEPVKAVEAKPKTKTEATPRRIVRSAAELVRDYVALNGFDAAEPFRVQANMTLWSVAKLYWPSYRGATMEQLLIAFRNANKGGFLNGDPNRLEAGAVLNPPSVEAVFAVDPVKAFREVRGDNEVIPLVTQNLIDAQLVDAGVAAKVADAQDRERAAGHGVQAMAEAGRRLLEEEKAAIAYERNLMSPDGGAPIGESRPEDPRNTGMTPAGDTAESAEPAEPSKPQTEVAEPDPSEDPAKDEAKAEPAPKTEVTPVKPVVEQPVEKVEAAQASDQPAKSGGPSPVALGIGALILALLGYVAMRSRRKDEPDDEAKKAPATVTIHKNVPPTSQAQLTALEKTVDEAVKNGTTAGAMGVGAMAYTMAQQEEAKRRQDDLTEKQPWLEPDDELPPLDPEEVRSAEETAQAAKQTAAVIDAVTLDLDDEPVKAEKTDKVAETVKTDRNATPESVAAPESDKERALWQALDAKLKLASNFVGLGALTEALELLEEVKRRGNPDQRERAMALEKDIKSRTDAQK